MMQLITPVSVWLIVLIVCLIVESVTTQLVTLWFSAGAAGAMLAAGLRASVMVQLVIFLALSIALLLVFRPLLHGVLRTKQDKTNADRIIDQRAVVTQTIDNRAGTGQIRLMGQVWTARSIQDENSFQLGETVIVREISGVKAMVEPVSEFEESKHV